MKEPIPYNPLDKKNLGLSVTQELSQCPIQPLPPAEAFKGAGIYAIYYKGDFPAYKPIVNSNEIERQIPIYVGKAIPAGGRKGGITPSIGKVLYRRLVEHAESIKQVNNLELGDFSCRFLLVDDIWIPLGENLLIEQYKPLWNTVIDGFGIHDPGSGRYNQRVSSWDVLHPGRSWANRCKPSSKTLDDILKDIKSFFG